MSKKRIIVLATIFIIALTFIYYSKPIKTSEELQGIIINKAAEDRVEKASIRFEGYTYRKIFKPNTFRGHIYINDKKYPHANFQLLKDSYSEILYWNGDENSPVDGVFVSLGRVFIGENFNSLEIMLTNEEGVGNNKVLVAPATTVKEAQDIMEEIKYIIIEKYAVKS